MPQHTLDPALARALSEVIAGECGQLRTLIEEQRSTIATLTARVAELEARPPPGIVLSDEELDALVAKAVAGLPPLPELEQIDLTPILEKIAALEAKPEPDLDAVEQRMTVRFNAFTEATKLQIAEATKVQLEHGTEDLATRVRIDFLNLENLHERVVALEARPVFDDIKRTELHGDLSLALSQSLERKLAALPPPAKGDKGDDGKSVTLDDVRGLFDEVAARWQLDFEKRAWEEVRRVLDAIPLPKDGVDGKNAFELEDFSLDYDGERRLEFKFSRDGESRTFVIEVPWPLDRQQYKRGQSYKRGDGVTFGGSWFIAQRDATPEDVPEESDAWRLAVKHGRDARLGKNGKGDPTTGRRL